MLVSWLDIKPVVWNIATWMWTARTLYCTRAKRRGGERKWRVSKTTTLDEHDVSKLTNTSADLIVPILERE
jgi:hypothetical protein